MMEIKILFDSENNDIYPFFLFWGIGDLNVDSFR